MDERRRQLGAAQAELMSALTKGNAGAASFAQDQLKRAANSLLHKRMRQLERAWPALREWLGGEWEAAFTEYARACQLEDELNATDDGMRWIARLVATRALPDAVRVELLRAKLEKSRIAVCALPQAHRLVLAIRIFDRVRSVSLPWRA